MHVVAVEFGHAISAAETCNPVPLPGPFGGGSVPWPPPGPLLRRTLATTAVGREAAVMCPQAFRALTLTRMRWPTSDATSLYLRDEITPPCAEVWITLHPLPFVLHLFQRKLKLRALSQRPGSAIKTSPTAGFPAIVGSFSTVGGRRCLAAVVDLAAHPGAESNSASTVAHAASSTKPCVDLFRSCLDPFRLRRPPALIGL